MAGIDKTYIDCREYEIYRQWWIDNYDKMVKELGKAIWLYPFTVFDVDDVTPEYLETHTDDIEFCKEMDFDNYPIWTTDNKEDLWLVKNCNIESFINRMYEVYNKGWKGFRYIKQRRTKKKQKYVNRKA